MVSLSGLSFLWDKIRLAHSWKFFAFGVRPRSLLFPFLFTWHIYKKIARRAVNCSSCRNAAFAFPDSFRRANRFDSDISPDIVAHPTSIRQWRPSLAFTRRAQDNTKIASESEGFRNERCAMVSPRKQERRPCVPRDLRGEKEGCW